MFSLHQDSGQKNGIMFKPFTKIKKGYNPVPFFAKKKKSFSGLGTGMKLSNIKWV